MISSVSTLFRKTTETIQDNKSLISRYIILTLVPILVFTATKFTAMGAGREVMVVSVLKSIKIVSLVFIVITQITFLRVLMKLGRNESPLLMKQEFHDAIGVTLKTIWTLILLLIIVPAPSLILLTVSNILFFIGETSTITVGIFLAVYGVSHSIIFGIRYFFAPYFTITAKASGITALKESSSMIKGYWWAIFGRMLAITITLYAVIAPLLLIFPLGIQSNPTMTLSFFAKHLFPTTLVTIISTFGIIYTVQLFLDTKKSKELPIPTTESLS